MSRLQVWSPNPGAPASSVDLGVDITGSIPTTILLKLLIFIIIHRVSGRHC
jgi:hypothetical protein